MKKSIIIVVTNYLNESVISSRRWRYIAEYLVKQGYPIIVISHDGKNENRETEVNGVTVISLKKLNSLSHNKTVPDSIRKYRSWTKPVRIAYYFIISKLEQRTLKKLVIEELNNGSLTKIKSKKFFTIISSVYNMDAFFIARELRHRLKIKQHICDIRDPLINPFFGNPASKVMGISNAKAIIKDADILTSVVEDFISDLQTIEAAKSKPTYIFPHAYRKLIEPETDGVFQKGARLSMAFVGTFYPSIHSIEPMAMAIRELEAEGIISPNSLNITVAGKNSDDFVQSFKQNKIEKYVTNMGFVSYAEAVRIQEMADILLFTSKIDEVGAYVGTTGKFPEYLSLNKEILMMFNVKKGADKQLDYYKSLSIGLCVKVNDSKSVKIIKDWIIDKIKEKESGKLVHNPNKSELEKYSVDYVGQQLINILER